VRQSIQDHFVEENWEFYHCLQMPRLRNWLETDENNLMSH
jgi:hypothetical protein